MFSEDSYHVVRLFPNLDSGISTMSFELGRHMLFPSFYGC